MASGRADPAAALLVKLNPLDRCVPCSRKTLASKASTRARSLQNTERHHCVTPGDIMSVCPSDFVGIRRRHSSLTLGPIGSGRPAIGRLARSSRVRRGSAGSECTRWPVAWFCGLPLPGPTSRLPAGRPASGAGCSRRPADACIGQRTKSPHSGHAASCSLPSNSANPSETARVEKRRNSGSWPHTLRVHGRAFNGLSP